MEQNNVATPDKVEQFLSRNFKGLAGNSDVTKGIIQEATESAKKITPPTPVENQENKNLENKEVKKPEEGNQNPDPEKKPDNQKKQEEQVGDDKKGQKKSIFTKQNKTAEDFKFESADDWKAVAKKYGIDVKENKDFNKFVSSVDKWRTDAQRVEETGKQAEEYKAIIENLPPKLFNAIKSHYSGSDWEESIKNSKPFDIEKPVDKQDLKTLVNYYFPNKFTDDDFAATEKPAALEIAETAAKDKFSVEHNNFISQRAKSLDDANKRIEAKTKSIDGSVGEMMKSFPDLDPVVVTDIKTTLASGDIQSLFFNKDGSYKQEAAEMLMLMKYGKQELQRLLEAGEHQIESRVTEEIVNRGSDKPGTIKTGGKGQELSDKAKAMLDSINRIGGKTTF